MLDAPETQLLEIRGHKIAMRGYNLECPGTPTVFIHGILVSNSFWEPVLPDSVRHHRPYYVLSLPGHYPSQFPKTYSSADITAELFAELHGEAIRRAVGDRPVRLVGWSTGGFSVLNLAARQPELAERVLSIAGFSRGAWLGGVLLLHSASRLGWRARFLFRTLMPWVMRSRRLYRMFFRHGAADGRAFAQFPGVDELLETLRRDARRHDPRAMTALFERIPDFNIIPLLGEMTVPTWIAGGTDDPFIPISETRFLAEQIPDAKLIEFPGAGHMFFAERPRLWHETLEAFLA